MTPEECQPRLPSGLHRCSHVCAYVYTHTSKNSIVIFYAAQLQQRPPFKHNQVQENSSKGKAQEGTASPEPHEKWKVWLSGKTGFTGTRPHAGCMPELQTEPEQQRFMGAMTGSG